MSLTSDQRLVQYTLTGSGQTLAVPFVFNQSADLVVVSTIAGIDAVLILNTDYTVANAGTNPTTATITLMAGASGTIITIYGNEDYLQSLAITPNGPFPSAAIMQTFDSLVMQIQQLAQQIARCVRLPNTNAAVVPIPLAGRAGLAIGFDGSGNLTLVSAGAGGGGVFSQLVAYPPAGNTPGIAGDYAIANGYVAFYTGNGITHSWGYTGLTTK